MAIVPNATYFSERWGSGSMVGRTPWGVPSGPRDALVPLFLRGIRCLPPSKSRPGGRQRTGGPPTNYAGVRSWENYVVLGTRACRRPFRPAFTLNRPLTQFARIFSSRSEAESGSVARIGRPTKVPVRKYFPALSHRHGAAKPEIFPSKMGDRGESRPPVRRSARGLSCWRSRDRSTQRK